MTDKNTTIYAVEFQGADLVIKGFSDVASAAGATGARVSSALKPADDDVKLFGGNVNKIGETFSKIKRDVDVFGGSAGAALANAADDAISMAIALGSGGTLAAVSALTIGVGLLSQAFSAHGDAAKQAARDAEEAMKREQEAFRSLADQVRKERKRITEDDIQQAKYDLEARNRQLDENYNKLIENSKKLAQYDEAQFAKVQDVEMGRSAARMAQNTKFVAQHDALMKQKGELEAERGRVEAEKAKVLEDLKSFNARKGLQDRIEAEDKAAQDAAKKRDVWRRSEDAKDKEFTDKRINAYWASWEKRKRADREGVDAMVGALDLAAKADADFLEEFDKGFVTWEQHEANVKKDADAEQKRAEEVAKAEEADRKHREELAAKAAAIEADTMATLYSASVNTGYEASMYLVGNATSFATNELRKFGDINRDNYREMLEFTPKARDALVARAQAAIFSMGLEAGTKSIFETGEAVRETALGFGMLAIPGMQGQAAMHFVSAGTHMAAASAYATIGGTAVGASFGIGATRGKGGLFGTGAEAATGIAGGTATPSGQGSTAAGPTSGTSTGNTQSTAPVVVNFVYEAGSMNAGDTQRLGRGVARGVRAANRDGFARRQMRQ